MKKTARDLALCGLLALAAAPVMASTDAPELPITGGTIDPAHVSAGTYRLDSHHGRIAWSIDHMGLSTYVGLVTEISATLVLDPADLAKTTLDVQADMSSIGTLYPPMDKNLKGPQYFDVATYPTARFVSSRVARTGPRTADVLGTLTMHGITKPVTLHVVFNQAGPNPIQKVYDVGFQGTATLDRFAFGLATDPRFIGRDIHLDIEGEFRLQK